MMMDSNICSAAWGGSWTLESQDTRFSSSTFPNLTTSRDFSIDIDVVFARLPHKSQKVLSRLGWLDNPSVALPTSGPHVEEFPPGPLASRHG
jgi:hypothetical protein